jgi:hypothetical protein
MFDNEKTDKLRERIKSLKPEETVPPSKEDQAKKLLLAVGKFLRFVITYFAAWGAQSIIFQKCGIVPLSLWDTFVVLFAAVYISHMIFRK